MHRFLGFSRKYFLESLGVSDGRRLTMILAQNLGLLNRKMIIREGGDGGSNGGGHDLFESTSVLTNSRHWSASSQPSLQVIILH